MQAGLRVFDQQLGRSIGFETCLRQALNHTTIKLTDTEAGTIRAIDAMRDDEQHWFNEVSEQLLYLHARAAITLFDDLPCGQGGDEGRTGRSRTDITSVSREGPARQDRAFATPAPARWPLRSCSTV